MARNSDRGSGRSPFDTAEARFLLMLLVAAPLILVFGPTSLLLGVGMIPTLVAKIIDRDPASRATVSVGLMNFAGCTPWLLELWQYGQTLGRAVAMITNPNAWLTMYGAAAAGWAIYFLVPPAVAYALRGIRERQVSRLDGRLKALVAEWGPAVRGSQASDTDDAEETEPGKPEQPADTAGAAG